MASRISGTWMATRTTPPSGTTTCTFSASTFSSTGPCWSRRLGRRDQHGPVDEKVLAEKVQVVVPLGGVVRVAIHVPDMRDAILFEILVHCLADANQTVLIAAAEPHQLQLLGNRRVRH